ncbi:MAG: hypothetical protein H6708_21790 [Kofleriaceae bacterium]|nr:hypothetical protein [Kofleriaceae bacterium]
MAHRPRTFALPLALAVAATGLVAACAGPKVSRSITTAQLGTRYARITGYFATAKAAPGGRHEEDVPGDLQHDLILDEATLMTAGPAETCIDVVVRTESQHDEPLEQLAPSCAVGGASAAVVVDDETLRVVDYSYEGMAPVIQVEGVAAAEYAALAVSQPAAKSFRVVERRARICCGAAGGKTVTLALDNARREVAGYDYSLTFEWVTR